MVRTYSVCVKEEPRALTGEVRVPGAAGGVAGDLWCSELLTASRKMGTEVGSVRQIPPYLSRGELKARLGDW